MAKPGRFITLEGGEGAGKSRLTKILAAYLRARGLEVVETREPGGSPGADLIRQLLVTGASDRWSVSTEALLFAAARNDHIEKVIAPSVERGAFVLCDRYVDSTLAYQVMAGGLPRSTFDALHRLIQAPSPDLTLMLDVDPTIGLARSRGAAVGEDRFEQRDLTFHTGVRNAFLQIAKENPRRCVVIDVSKTPDEVDALALAAIDAKLFG